MKPKPRSTRGVPLTLLLAGLIIACAGASAASSEEFLTRYECTNVSEPVDGEVSLTFTTEIFSIFAENIQGAVLELKGSVDPTATYATFALVDVVQDGAVRLSADITVPAEEYDAWQQLEHPTLSITFDDAAGTSHSTAAETFATILPPEEEQP